MGKKQVEQRPMKPTCLAAMEAEQQTRELAGRLGMVLRVKRVVATGKRSPRPTLHVMIDGLDGQRWADYWLATGLLMTPDGRREKVAGLVHAVELAGRLGGKRG